MHTTISVLEGIHEYKKAGYTYRLKELLQVQASSEEFLLKHRLYKSHRTGRIINAQFTEFHYPARWHYDILRALDYFSSTGHAYDSRMQDAINLLMKKRNRDGTWNLNAKYPGQTHFEMEKAGQPSRWNTLRALRALRLYVPGIGL